MSEEVRTDNKVRTLQEELNSLHNQIATLEVALKIKPDYGIGQGDPAVTQWGLDQALLRQLRERATHIQQTLSRAEDGDYGICQQCGEPIHPDRLAVLPTTTVCIKCAQNR